jgi:dTDP-4-dehydrorhamnose reductase
VDLAKLQEIEKSWPRESYIINAVGLIPQRKVAAAAADEMSYVRINGLFPHILQLIAQQHGHALIHITTDCVFNGTDGMPHRATDYPTETGIYGASKSIGEPANATIIRTSIIGLEPHEPKVSLLEWVLGASKRGEKQLRGYQNHHWNGVTCHQLAKFIDFIITKEMLWSGVKAYVITIDLLS